MSGPGLDKVSFAYSGGSKVLEEISLNIEPGEIVALLGSSGVGKSTLLRLLAGLALPSAGEVKVEGPVGVVFQRPTLLPWRDVLGNVRFGLECLDAGLVTNEANRRAIALLDEVGLANVHHARPHALSEGMAQRVSFVRALLVEPKLLLLDEPFSALDVATRSILRQLLLRHVREAAVATLFISHSLADVAGLADRALILRGGTLHEEALEGSPGTRTKAQLAEALERLNAALCD